MFPVCDDTGKGDMARVTSWVLQARGPPTLVQGSWSVPNTPLLSLRMPPVSPTRRHHDDCRLIACEAPLCERKDSTRPPCLLRLLLSCLSQITCTGNEDHLSDCNIEMVDPSAYSGDPSTQGKLCPLPAWAIEDGGGEGGGLSPDPPQLTRRDLRSTKSSSAQTPPTHGRWSRETYRKVLAMDASMTDVEELVRQYLSFARTGEAAPAATSQALGPTPPKTLLEQALTQKFIATRAAWTKGRSRTAMSIGGDDFFVPDIQAVLICFDPPPNPEAPETPETSPPPPSAPDAPESPEASPPPYPPDESSMPYIPPPPPDYPPPAPPSPPVYGHNGDGSEVVDGDKKGSGDKDSGSGSYMTGSDSSSGKLVAAAPEDTVENVADGDGSSADAGSGEDDSADAGDAEESSADAGDGVDVEATEGGDVTPDQGSGSGEA